MSGNEPSRQPPGTRVSLTPLDFGGLAMSSLGLMWAALAVLRLQPSYGKMFDDFGGRLPALTELCLRPWFPVALAFLPLALVVDGILRNASPRGRALRMGLAVFLLVAAFTTFLVAMYLPIFSIAGSVK